MIKFLWNITCLSIEISLFEDEAVSKMHLDAFVKVDRNSSTCHLQGLNSEMKYFEYLFIRAKVVAHHSDTVVNEDKDTIEHLTSELKSNDDNLESR